MSIISAGTTSTTTLIHSGDTTGQLVFKTNDTGSGGTTAVTIDTAQNVGIGTSSPATRLDVQSTQGVQKLTSTTGTNSVYQQFVNTGGSAYVGLNNSTGADFGNAAYALQVYHAGAYPIVFATSNTERMRIDSSGNLLVNTTSTFGGGKLNISALDTTSNAITIKNTGTANNIGFVLFYNSSTVLAGQIYQSGATSVVYATSSDYRLKENIKPMTGALAKVAQLKPCTYKWKNDSTDGQGFIAHELQEVVPDAVVGQKDAVNEDGSIKPQGIDTSYLVATLTAAIQELKAINDQQAQTITALTARIEALENK